MRRLHAALQVAAPPERVRAMIAHGWQPFRHSLWVRTASTKAVVHPKEGASRCDFTVDVIGRIPFTEPILDLYLPDWLTHELWRFKQAAEVEGVD
jgi:hypothetical protein